MFKAVVGLHVHWQKLCGIGLLVCLVCAKPCDPAFQFPEGSGEIELLHKDNHFLAVAPNNVGQNKQITGAVPNK